ncbi:MAG: hypothetical protein KatS3mg104_0585 [Phycisphaerae bacterium]|nr:MAG: hypothetical protein KatS3mg104_0585 [Phycisphaerae bacterium]
MGPAQLVKSIYQQLLTLGNKSFEGSYLFAGDKLDRPPFEEFAGGIKFNGSEQTLANQFDDAYSGTLQVNGAEVWGALSTRVESSQDNSPVLLPSTRIIDLAGTTGQGITLGVIRISDGTNTANIDLTQARYDSGRDRHDQQCGDRFVDGLVQRSGQRNSDHRWA